MSDSSLLRAIETLLTNLHVEAATEERRRASAASLPERHRNESDVIRHAANAATLRTVAERLELALEETRDAIENQRTLIAGCPVIALEGS